MRVQVTIAVDNTAFEDNAGDELARILRWVAEYASGKDYLSLGYAGRTLRDANGNIVGQVIISGKD